MPMKKSVPAANPDAYVTALSGWQRQLVEQLREGMSIADAIARKLTREAVALNEQLGNPTDAAKPGKAKAATQRKPSAKKSAR